MTNRRSVVQEKGGMLQEFVKQAKLVGRLIGGPTGKSFIKADPDCLDRLSDLAR